MSVLVEESWLSTGSVALSSSGMIATHRRLAEFDAPLVE
jgi:hypothetical protein